MANDLNTEIKIGADASGVEAGVGRAKRSLADLGSSAKKAGQDAGAGIGAIGAGGDKAAKDVERATRNIQGQLQRAVASFEAGERGSRKFYESLARQRGADVNTLKPLLDQLDAYKAKSEAAAQASVKASTSLSGLGAAAGLAARAVAAIGIGASVGEFIRMADASTNVASRLGLVTSSAAELASVQQRLFQVAQSSRVSFVDLVGTYAQVARSTKDLGVSQTALLGVIQTISQAVTISGGSAASAQAALTQLSQGFASGTLRGEELNSVMEQTPRLAQAIAEGLGISIGKLREMGQAGELTSEKVLGALEKSAAGVAAEFGKMAVTVEQSSTQAANSVLKLVGAFDKLSGVSSTISGAITSISRGIDFLTGDLEKLGSQGALRAAADDVLDLDRRATILRNGMRTGFYGPNFQKELDDVNAKLLVAKQRFRELDQQLGGSGADPRDQSGFTGRGTSYANEAARQSKLRDDANAFRLNQSGVPASYLKDMAELIRLNQAGVIVGKEYTDALKKQQDILLQKTGVTKGAAAAANQEQNTYESLIASIRAKIEEDKLELAGGAALTESQRLRIKLDQDLLSGKIKLGSAREAEVRGLIEEKAASEAQVTARRALNKANIEAGQVREKYLASLETGITKIQADIAAQQEATERMGLSKTAIADLDAAKLEMLATDTELQAIKALDRNLDQQTYDSLKEQAKLYRDLSAAKKDGAAKEIALDLEKANEDAAKDAAKEWERAADDINRSLTDALLRGFESGKDFAKNLRDTVVNMFKTMVLRPVISAVMAPISGGIQGMMGGMAGGGGGGSGIMGGIQTASNLNTLYGAGSQALFGGAAGASAASLGYANIVGMAGGDAIGALATANGMWAGVATGAQGAAQAAIAANVALEAGTATALASGTTATAAGGTAAAGAGGISGALAAIPVWGWALAAVAVLGTMLSKKQTLHSGAGAIYNSDTGVQEGAGIYNLGTFGMGDVREYNKDGQALASGIAAGLGSTLDGIAKAFGQKAGYEVATAFADDTSKDGAWGALRISQGGKDVLDWEDTRTSRWAPKEFADGAEGQAQYLAAIAKDTRQVLLDMDLPGWADTMLNRLGELSNMDQLSAAVAQIAQAQTAFEAFAQYMPTFAGLADTAISKIVDASGGVGALAGNMGAFVDGFYRDSEKLAINTQNVTGALAKLGFEMPATRDEFKALVQSQIALGDAGAQTTAGLLAVSGAVSAVLPPFEDAAAGVGAAIDTVSDAMRRLQSDTASLEVQLLRAQGDTTGADAAQRTLDITGLADAEIAVYDYNAALRAQISALDAAAEAAAEQASIRLDFERQLLGLSGDTAALRLLEIAGMDAANVALYDRVQALTASQAAEQAAAAAAQQQASTRAGFERQLQQLQGDTAALRLLDIAGMDAANVALYDRVQALTASQAAEQAAADKAKQVAQERYGIETQLLQLQGNTAALRARELAALDPANRADQLRVYALTDAQAATKAAADAERDLAATRVQSAQDAYRAAQESTGSALDAISRSVGAERAIYESARTAAADAAQEIKSVIDTLTGSIKDLYSGVDSTRQASATEGASFITAALQAARSTGYLPDAAGLSDAITAARGGLGSQNYATQFEADRAQLVMAGQLSELSDIAKPQLTAAERTLRNAESQLKTLDDILKNAQSQVDAVRGISTTVGTIPAALAGLQSALLSEAQAKAMAQSATPPPATPPAATPNASGLSGPYAALVESALKSAAYTTDDRLVYDTARMFNVTSSELDKLMGWTAGTSLEWAKKNKLPEFAVGTNYVPQDMAAIVHKGEMIVPAAYNPATSGAASNNAEVVAELRALRKQNERMEARLASIEGSNNTMANLLDEVTEGGHAMRSEVMA